MISRETLERHIGELEDEVSQLKSEVARLRSQLLGATYRDIRAQLNGTAPVQPGQAIVQRGSVIGHVRDYAGAGDMVTVQLGSFPRPVLPPAEFINRVGEEISRRVLGGTLAPRPPIGGGFAHMDETAEKLKPVPEPSRWRLLEVDDE